MYIYNVTINIQEDIHDKWLEWMQKEHIPDMLNTGKFMKALMTKVLVKEEMGGSLIRFNIPPKIGKCFKNIMKKTLRRCGERQNPSKENLLPLGRNWK